MKKKEILLKKLILDLFLKESVNIFLQKTFV